MSTCFGPGADAELLDRQPFKFHHGLLGHPALTLENLARVIPALPQKNVTYSNALLKTSDDFEGTFDKRPTGRSIEETIESIRVSDSYVMVNSPQLHPSFAELYKELISEVQGLMKARGLGTVAVDPKLFLFIASPNSITPFHIDRYSTFLMQFRGSKQVYVFAPWDERVVSAPHCEAYVAYRNTKLPWRDENDSLANCYDFQPGDAVHIPFVAGHHVRNGPDDVSISMSIIFNTPQTVAWRGALNFNYRARRILSRVGMAPTAVGNEAHALRDAAKSQVWGAVSTVQKALQRQPH
jgi:hypothetical protein